MRWFSTFIPNLVKAADSEEIADNKGSKQSTALLVSACNTGSVAAFGLALRQVGAKGLPDSALIDLVESSKNADRQKSAMYGRLLQYRPDIAGSLIKSESVQETLQSGGRVRLR